MSNFQTLYHHCNIQLLKWISASKKFYWLISASCQAASVEWRRCSRFAAGMGTKFFTCVYYDFTTKLRITKVRTRKLSTEYWESQKLRKYFHRIFLADDSKSSKTQNLQIWEILKLRFHKLGFTRLWELWITFHSNCEKNKTENPKTTILSHQECKLEIKILSEKPFLSNFMKIQSDNLPFRRDS